MDVAYTKHSSEARRKNKSQTNLNHLTLAPLTSKLPLPDHDELPDFATSAVQYYNPSYLQGKSAPATPRLLSSRSPARTRTSSPTRRSSSVHAGRSSTQLPKSKSASHLHGLHGLTPTNTTTTAAARRHRHGRTAADDARDKSDSDWLLHAGAFISTEAREGKGQAWLISRASTTSLTGARDVEEEAYERELARERELASRRGSRRGSFDDDGGGILTPSHRSHSSRLHHHLKTPLRTPLRTPMRSSALEHQGGERDYFTPHSPAEDGQDEEEEVPGPDFVSLDEKLEAIEGGGGDSGQAADEAAVRRLLKGDRAGAGSWMGSLLGWSLFSVEENDDEGSSSSDDADDGEMTDGSYLSRSTSTKSFHDIATDISKERIAPPKADEGGWHDAAWLLSVASKVLL